MTRDIRIGARSVQFERYNKNYIENSGVKNTSAALNEKHGKSEKAAFSAKKLWKAYISLLDAEKKLGGIIEAASCRMAEKIAREGLFGEDKNNGKGRTVDYVIAETYEEIRYINREMANLDEHERVRYVGEAAKRRREGTAAPGRDTGILRTFNGF